MCFAAYPGFLVALLAEGVDRNQLWRKSAQEIYASPSSRRAWIEILSGRLTMALLQVALLAEGVDRNLLCAM